MDTTDIEVLDFKVTDKKLPKITSNFEEMKAFLQVQLKKYELIVVTQDNLEDSKKVQKELARLKKTMDDYRKDIKKELYVPISEFEDKCKELIDIVDKVNAPIKEGIEVFNDKIRQEKLDYANEIINAHSNNFGLNKNDFKILDSFTNLSGTKKSIADELDKQMHELVKIKEQKEKNIELLKQQIEQLNNTFELEVKIEFKDIENKITNDNFMELSQYLLTESNRRKQTQDRIKEQLAHKEQLEKEKTEQIKQEQQESIIEKDVRKVDEETGEIFELKSIILKLTGTQEQLQGLRNYIDISGITYEKIKGKKDLNVYEKLSKARIDLQNTELKKSGKNKHLGFEYMELMDFLPTINEINDQLKMISLFTSDSEGTKLTIVDAEKPDDKIVFTSTSAKAKLSGATSPVQELGAEHTYMRRYMYMEAYEITERDAVDGMLGDAPSKPFSTQKGTNTPETAKKEKIDENSKTTESLTNIIMKLAIKKNADLVEILNSYKVEKLTDLTIKQAKEIMNNLQK